MKTLLIIFIGIICMTSNAQNWLDSSCKNIEDSVNELEFKSASDRNVLKIIINQAGEIEINEVVKTGLSEIQFKELVLDYVTNPKKDKDKADKPEKVFIQLKSFNKNKDQLANIKAYVQDVYLYLWDKASDEKYDTTYIDLKCKKRKKIFDAYPLRLVSEISKNNKKKTTTIRRGPGLPNFGGDVKKN